MPKIDPKALNLESEYIRLSSSKPRYNYRNSKIKPQIITKPPEPIFPHIKLQINEKNHLETKKTLQQHGFTGEEPNIGLMVGEEQMKTKKQ